MSDRAPPAGQDLRREGLEAATTGETSLQLGDVVAEVDNLYHLLDMLVEILVGTTDWRADCERAVALAWVARDGAQRIVSSYDQQGPAAPSRSHAAHV